MLDLSVQWVEDLVEDIPERRYRENRPVYQLLATWLNANGGKNPNAKRLDTARAFTAEELMQPWELPTERRPRSALVFTPGEAQAILAAIPHLKGANWVFQALKNRVMPLDEIERHARG